jgi:hypothetical protein
VEDFAALENDQFKVGWYLGSIEITKYTGPSKTAVIPARIGRWPVTSIGESAFAYNQLTSVTLPANMELEGGSLPCEDAYNANGKKAGTYTKDDRGDWACRP